MTFTDALKTGELATAYTLIHDKKPEEMQVMMLKAGFQVTGHKSRLFLNGVQADIARACRHKVDGYGLRAIDEQVKEARRVIELHGYKTPATVNETKLIDGKSVFGFRFQEGKKVGDVLDNGDGTTAIVHAVVISQGV